MKASAIRQSFLDYFRERGHTIVESAPVVPQGDPTLLFTNAGMNQFKDVFLGTGQRPYKRAADTQKCIRAGGKHNDLDEVGKDGYHQTLFEMLGNWSFGDYFKREAIEWAWDLLTRVWGIDKARLYATVHHTDDEARALWCEVTDIAPDRVLVFGDKDNFWEMGTTGPCGPCTEIHIDRGEGTCDRRGEPGHECAVNAGCARYIELWNLVFIQYERKADRSLEPLPAKHVDTGAGLERVAQVLQGVYSNYDTDLFQPLVQAVARRSGVAYDRGPAGTPHRAIADHLRCLAFSIADGALPGNTGRGSVLRRVLRRASRFFHTLGVNEPAMGELVPALVEVMGEAFPELRANAEVIRSVLTEEEEQFLKTLDKGTAFFDKERERLLAEGRRVVPGAIVFTMHDTHGFPPDLTQQMAEEAGLKIDDKEYERLREEARDRSRGASQFKAVDLGKYKHAPTTQFSGYDVTTDEARVAAAGPHELVLERTPFYAESGGQVGDTGAIVSADGRLEFEVLDTQKTGQVVVHLGRWLQGDPQQVKQGTEVIATVDGERRDQLRRNHTATHLLHWALHQVLDKSAVQKGSEVAPGRLRFDFAWKEKLSAEQLREVERLVNEKIADNSFVMIEEMPIDQARKRGAIAMFGEKYGDLVRVIDVGGYSVELCGGTHVERSGDIGLFKLVTEEALAKGVRRMAALTGDPAVARGYHDSFLLAQIAQSLKARPEEALERIARMQEEIRELHRKNKEALALALPSWEQLEPRAIDVNGVKLLATVVEGADPDALRSYGDQVKQLTTPFVAYLFAEAEGKVPMVTAISKPLVERGWHSRDLLRPVAQVLGGGGGGKRADMCQGSGKDPSQLPAALEKARAEVAAKVG